MSGCASHATQGADGERQSEPSSRRINVPTNNRMSETPLPPARFYSPDGRFVQAAGGWQKVTQQTCPPMSPDGKAFWDGTSWRPWGKRKSPVAVLIALIILVVIAVSIVVEIQTTKQQASTSIHQSNCRLGIGPCTSNP